MNIFIMLIMLIKFYYFIFLNLIYVVKTHIQKIYKCKYFFSIYNLLYIHLFNFIIFDLFIYDPILVGFLSGPIFKTMKILIVLFPELVN